MSDSPPVAAAPKLNPFESPDVVRSEVAAVPLFPSRPRPWLMVGCIATGIVLCGITNFHYLINVNIPWLIRAASIANILGYGALAGVGMALLIEAWTRRRIDWLAPGHWLLVASIAILVGQLASWPWQGQPGWVLGISSFFTAPLIETGVVYGLSFIWYLAVIRWVPEAKVWRIYAGTAAVLNAFRLSITPASLLTSLASFDGLQVIVKFLYLCAGLLEWATVLVLITGVIIDLTWKVPRDIYHWIGVVLVLGLPITFGVINAIIRSTM